MSTPTTANPPAREAAGVRRPPTARLRHTPGGAALGQEAGPEAQRLAAAILEVLAGVRTPAQAAEVLGVSQARYFQIETRAMQALLAGCQPRPRGPGRKAEQELVALRREHERLRSELNRHQTLLRLAQRTVGLAPPKATVPKAGGKDQGKKRPRRPVVRALRAAEVLQQRSQEQARAAAAPAETAGAATPASPPPG